jgi:8-oxo-dGTP pyrophosphatase MutT (NUDIX family)
MSNGEPKARQYAALPYRQDADGVIEVLLVTSRETSRWIIPKGWPAPGLSPQDSAAREAMEEAGVVGRIDERSIGTYRYEKRLLDGSLVPCTVEVYALKVEQQLDSWEEQSERNSRWFELQTAADVVQEPDLSAIIRALRALLGS